MQIITLNNGFSASFYQLLENNVRDEQLLNHFYAAVSPHEHLKAQTRVICFHFDVFP